MFDGAHERSAAGIPLRGLHDTDSRLAQQHAHERAPLLVAITDRHAMTDDPRVIGGG